MPDLSELLGLPGNSISSFFWGDRPSGPGSLAELQSRRKIAQALMGKRSPFPKTLGEGLTYAGERIADVAMERDLAAREAAYQKLNEGEANKAYPPTATSTDRTAQADPEADTSAEQAPVRTAALAPPTEAAEPKAAPAYLNMLAATMMEPRPSETPPAGPVGNAPNVFGPSIINAATGSRRDVPAQPSPGRFSPEFGRLAAVPSAHPVNAVDTIGTAMMSPQRTMSEAPALAYNGEGDTPDPFVPSSIARAGPMPDLGGWPINPTPMRLAALGGIPTDIPPAPSAVGLPPNQRVGEAFGALPPPPPQQTQVAQAGPAPYRPMVERQPTEDVELYQKNPIQRPRTPQSPREIQALRTMARFPDDENIRRIWEPVARQEEAMRLYTDAQNKALYQKQLEMLATQKAANQVAARGKATTELQQREMEYGLGTQPSAAEDAKNIVQTPYGPVNRLWNTPQSPNRSGIPTPEQNPGFPQRLWDIAQAKKIEADLEAGQKAAPQFERMIRQLSEINNHPGVKDGSALGLVGRAIAINPASKAGDLAARLDQVKNEAFLNVYQDTLKGGGQIANIEGTKGTAARIRVNQASSPEAFRAAMKDYENAVREDYAQVQLRLNRPVTAWKRQASDPVAPDPGSIRVDFDDGIPRRYLGRGKDPIDYNEGWEKLR